MKTRMRHLIAIAIVALSGPAESQIVYQPGKPRSSSGDYDLLPAPSVTLPAVDLEAARREDAVNDVEKTGPWRFAIPHAVRYDIRNSGRWDVLPDGGRLWRLELRSPGAHSLNIIFDAFALAGNAELFLYNASRTHVLGPFTRRNNLSWGGLATAPVDGDALTVEYYLPAGTPEGRLSVGQVAHGYRGLKDMAAGFGDSGPCNNNVVCPEWNSWRCQIRSSVMLMRSGSGFCSGTLLNNTSGDGDPLILTANHCTGSSASNWVFLFNWDSPTCNPATNSSRTQTVSGATILARNSQSDFALVRMSSKPPATYNVYYSGWDASGTASRRQVGIHHPAGDIKKISLDTNPAVKAGSGTSTRVWRVVWEDGTTEGGSSGSGLWDQNGRLIGQLQGGGAACSRMSSSDNYGRLEVSWTLGANRYLDPDSTGKKVMDGMGAAPCTGPTGIAGRPGLRAFPEMGEGLFQVEFDAAADLEVADVTGRAVRTFKLRPGRNALDLRKFPAGVYWLRLPSRPEFTQRVVIGG